MFAEYHERSISGIETKNGSVPLMDDHDLGRAEG